MFVQMPSWHMFPASHSSTSAGHREVSGDQALWSQTSVTVVPLPYGAFILPTHMGVHAKCSQDPMAILDAKELMSSHPSSTLTK